MMNGIFLRLYMRDGQKHRHHMLSEWLLQKAKELGIHGGTMFHGVAGFGHHGKLHFQHFFELAGELPMQIDFVVTEEEANRFLDAVRRENVRLFYMKVPVTFGVLNPDDSDASEFRD